MQALCYEVQIVFRFHLLPVTLTNDVLEEAQCKSRFDANQVLGWGFCLSYICCTPRKRIPSRPFTGGIN